MQGGQEGVADVFGFVWHVKQGCALVVQLHFQADELGVRHGGVGFVG